MIPRNIKREHIIKAIEEIKISGVPVCRISKKFLLKYNGKTYPPKYVLSLSNKYANGKKLNPDDFSGGMETNGFLQDLGFDIENITTSEQITRVEPLSKEKEFPPKKKHSERCPICKETIKKFLQKVFGEVQDSPRFEVGTIPEDFRATPYYENLKEVYEVLQKHRGFSEIVKTRSFPPSDLFVKDPGFIFEYDESQHFTQARKIALEHYPEGLKLGFDRRRWIELCKKINARDNDPPYRDEQRAWYETIRDFLPAIKGFEPTVRVFMKDFIWCNLNPDNPLDVERFKNILEGKLSKGDEIEIMKDPNPYIARIIITNNWEGDPEYAKKLLADVLDKWPKGEKVKFLMTCGGFVQFKWPKYISYGDIKDNKSPKIESVEVLVREAKECAKAIITNGLGEKLKEVTDYFTLGIDSYKEKISMTQSYIGELHIELALMIDLRNDKIYWTGKSYPTTGQQYGLVRIADLKKHFLNLSDVGKVMLLGCHDLSMFNNRNMENTGRWRKKIKMDFRRLSKEEKPVIVLHHPHTTVKVTTWRNSWRTLEREVPTVQKYTGAGRYYEPDRIKYDPLNDVLKATKKAPTIDFIIRGKLPR